MKIYLDELQKYVDQIDTRTYHDYTIDEGYCFQDCTYTRGNEMRLICYGLFERQYIHMRKIFIQ